MLDSKRTAQDKDPEKRLMLMEAFVKVSGKTTKNTEMEFLNTLTEQNTMVNGKPTFVMDLEHIFIPTEISTKETGTTIFSKAWVLTTTQMETFIKENGKAASPTDKAITFTKAEKPFTKETGKTARKKVLDNS